VKTPKNSKVTEAPKVSIVVTATEIAESDKLKHITIKSIKWLITEKYAGYLTTSLDKSKRLVHFLSHKCLEVLINDQRCKKTIVSTVLTLATIMEQSDETIRRMLADYIRPKSIEQYKEQMFIHTDTMKESKFPFGIKGYDVHVHPKVCKILDEILMYDDFFRFGATADELKRLPKMVWGTESNPGVFRIAMECFQPFTDNFKNMLTEEKLKACNKMEDFIDMFRGVNDEYYLKADAMMIAELQMQVPQKLAGARDSAKNKAMQKKLLDGIPEKKRLSEFKMLQSEQDHEAVRRQQVKTVAEDHEKEEIIHQVDQSEDEYDDVPISEDYFMADEEWNELMILNQQKEGTGPKFVKKKFDFGKAGVKAPDKKVLPCFSQAYYGKCELRDQCGYSHDPAVIKGYLNTEMKKLKASPFYESFGNGGPKVRILEYDKSKTAEDDDLIKGDLPSGNN
jgi:hypothetical protein